MTRLATVDQLLRKALAVLDASGTADGFNNLGGRNIMDKITKRHDIERLTEYSQICGSFFCCIAVPGRTHHRQIGIPRTDFSRKPDTADGPSHDDIAEDEIDLR